MLNILIFVYIMYRVTNYLLDQGFLENHMVLDGMRIDESTYSMFVRVLVLQVVGFVIGLVGLFSSETKKLFPILGTLTNGALVVSSVGTL